MDKLAIEGDQLDKKDIQVTYQNKRTISKSPSQKKWHQEHPGHNKSDRYYKLRRADTVILLRVSTRQTD